MSNTPLLTVKGLACARNQQLLFKDFELSLMPGQVVQIVGSNGSGKTTLLSSLAGLHVPLLGTIERRAAVQLSEHALALNEHLTVLENIIYYRGMSRSLDLNYQYLLSKFKLDGLVHRYVSELSRGQQQRLALSRLQVSSSVWLLDEPFTSLDAESCELMKGLFKQQLDLGGAIVFTSHREIEISDCDIVKI